MIRFLKIAKKHNSCFKQSKYDFNMEEIPILEVIAGKGQEISINIIGPLPKSNRMDVIVVIVDRFIKMIRLKTIIMNIFSESIAKIYRDNIWKLYGIPKKILSNKEP